MDCKHDIEADKEPTGFICKECLRRFEEKELVILTKEQRAKMEAIIKYAQKIVTYATTDFAVGNRVRLMDALEAHKKGK